METAVASDLQLPDCSEQSSSRLTARHPTMHDDMPDAKMAANGDDASHLEVADIEKELEIEHDPNEQISYHEGRKIIHKIDRRLITALGLMFAVSLMDRTNLGNANIAGMGVDLGLTKGFRYSTIIILFFVPYVILQWPSAIVVRKLGPRVFLPAVTFLWGIVQLVRVYEILV